MTAPATITCPRCKGKGVRMGIGYRIVTCQVCNGKKTVPVEVAEREGEA